MTAQYSIRNARRSDGARIAKINSEVFLGDRNHEAGAREWVQSLLGAYPVYQYFVLETDGVVAGYAGWQIHGGFHRAEPVVELDQLGIDRKYQMHGFGAKLLEESEQGVVSFLMAKNDRIESHVSVVVWAYAFNFNALSVYAKSFGEGVKGMRIQFGDRAETMLRKRVPIIRKVRPENV